MGASGALCRFASSRWAPIASTALTLAVAATALWLMGRSPLCPCGHVAVWTGEVHGPENSQQLFDWYSLSHVVHGLIFYGASWLVLRRCPIAWRLALAVSIEAGWEVLENSPIIIDRYRSVTLAWGYAGDSILNSMSDIGCMVLGFNLAHRLSPWTSVALVIALELVALSAIRDNLTLNIWMLVAPNTAIRAWQAGG